MKKGRIIFSICALSFMLVAATILMIVLAIGYANTSSIDSVIAIECLGILLIFTVSLISFCRRLTENRKIAYKVYENDYSEYISGAFVGLANVKNRNELLKAIQLYNADQYFPAIKILENLAKKAKTDKDKFAAMMFLALTYTEMGGAANAIALYNEIIKIYPRKSTVWSNLGLIYTNLGNFKKAREAYNFAVECNPENPYSYANIANLLIKEGEFAEAIPYGKKALEFKGNLYQASNALAIVYLAIGDTENSEKYFKISVANGVNAKDLRAAMEQYKA